MYFSTIFHSRTVGTRIGGLAACILYERMERNRITHYPHRVFLQLRGVVQSLPCDGHCISLITHRPLYAAWLSIARCANCKDTRHNSTIVRHQRLDLASHPILASTNFNFCCAVLLPPTPTQSQQKITNSSPPRSPPRGRSRAASYLSAALQNSAHVRGSHHASIRPLSFMRPGRGDFCLVFDNAPNPCVKMRLMLSSALRLPTEPRA